MKAIVVFFPAALLVLKRILYWNEKDKADTAGVQIEEKGNGRRWN